MSKYKFHACFDYAFVFATSTIDKKTSKTITKFIKGLTEKHKDEINFNSIKFHEIKVLFEDYKTKPRDVF